MENTLRKTTITYREWLLGQSKAGKSFKVRRIVDDRAVDLELPASIIRRRQLDEPLNHCEAECFEFVDANPHILTVLGDYVVTLADNGHTQYSMDFIIHHLRVEHEKQFKATSEWKLDDHYSPYLARWLNELMDFPFFRIKGVKGEPPFGDRHGLVLVCTEPA